MGLAYIHSFGYWLRRRRKALDLTQAELAQRVSCSLDLIQKIEADARRPSRQLAEKLAGCFGLDATERVAFIQAARATYERAIALVRAQLGEKTFAAAWAEGRTLTLEQAIADALDDLAQVTKS